MEWIDILWEGFSGSLSSVANIATIVIPIMVVMQIAKEAQWLDKIAGLLTPLARLLDLPSKATLPLVVGLVFGLAYGAGVIIQSAKDGELTHRDLYIISLFLVICHAIFEDTMVFVAIGVSGSLLLGSRIILALLFTAIIARLLYRRCPAASGVAETN
ncbi:MAG: nucleoside recognition protein [Firmicutes bacterium]|nr:nucleoside recognition protein [Bacillota bacterium]